LSLQSRSKDVDAMAMMVLYYSLAHDNVTLKYAEAYAAVAAGTS
jgi:hypothetical protein